MVFIVPNIKIVLVLATVVASRVKANLTCLSCKDSPLPRDCQYTTICGSHEVCYTNSYVTSVGSVRHEMGCMDQNQCSGGQSVRSANNFLTCTECCNGTLCNSGLCGQKGIEPLASGSRGPICYSCDQQLNPNTCHVIKECGRDEICEENLHRYQSEASSGNLIGKRGDRNERASEHCALKCCGKDLCNADCSGPRVVQNVNVIAPLVTKPAITISKATVPPAAQTTPTTTTSKTTLSVAHKTTPTSVQTTDICIDKRTGCSGYLNYCNMDWGLLNCRKTCNLCNVALADPCIDRSLCPQSLHNCNTDWGLHNCVRSCNRCSEIISNQHSTHDNANCKKHDYWPASACETYKNYCSDPNTYIKDVCIHYCGHC